MSIPNDEGDDELRRAVSKNEARAEWGGAAVVFGLIVEVVLTAEYRHGESIIEAWGPVGADALIALGVAAEILFARKARSKAEALQHRSDLKIAEANARASEAMDRAARAELESNRLKVIFSGRRILPEQQSRISAAILDKASSLDVVVEFQTSDPEAFTYALDIVGVFRDAGVEKIRFTGNAYLIGTVFGLFLSSSDKDSAASIAGAFTSASVPIDIFEKDLSRHLPSNEVAPNLYVFVAPKLPAAIPAEMSAISARE